jgi:hypothetical protein
MMAQFARKGLGVAKVEANSAKTCWFYRGKLPNFGKIRLFLVLLSKTDCEVFKTFDLFREPFY